MRLPSKAPHSPAVTGRLRVLAQAALFCSLGASAASAADAYFSPIGTDAPGHAIGTDCTLAAPCKTVAKALSFLASNIASGAGPNRNYTLLFDGANGPFYLPATQILTSAHTVASGFTTTFDVYNGTQAAWSGGLDTAGTWTSTTLPSGASGCVSSYLKNLAPLTGANAASYVGVAWINGHRVQEVINPRSGNPWATVPGTAGGADRGFSMFVGPVASLRAGSTSIAVSDLARIGIVGQPIALTNSAGGFLANRNYWILTKSGQTGGGNITVSWSPGGTPITSTVAANIDIQDPVQSENAGDRSSPPGKNTFPYNASQADFHSAYNQTDVKGELADISPALAPVAEVTTSGVVVLNSRMFTITNLFPGVGYRVWNRFEDLGANGYTGELYTDRTTGAIYYTPRTDLGETCASINAKGKAIIPSTLETVVRISSAPADIAAAGGAAGAAVGNMVFKDIIFEHTNTSVFTGVANLAGAVGGFITTVASHNVGALNWAVATVGAKNVTFNAVTMAHFGGSALAISWGSNHDTVENSQLYDAGGALITAGVSPVEFNAFRFNNDASAYGTAAYGPTTPSFNTGSQAVNQDLTGASDCCQTFTNNFIYNGGIVHPGMSCIAIAGWQNFTISHNTMHDCGNYGISASTDVGVTNGPPSFHGTVGAIHSGNSVYYPFFGNSISYNEIYNCGYETTVLGAGVPGGTMSTDFGCLYTSGPQDGDGTNSANSLKISYNKIHDVSSAAYPVLKWNGSAYIVWPHGYDAVLDYNDGNDGNGIIEWNNLFYNRSAAAIGATTWPTRIAMHSGNIRTVRSNNIWAGVFPAGSIIYNTYIPRLEATPNFNIPGPTSNHTYPAGACASTCYIMNKYNIYSATFSGSLTTGNNTPPTCTSGTCKDGGVTWTFVEKLPGAAPYLQDYSNITAWQVTGDAAGTTKDYPFTDAFPTDPEYGQFSSNLYSMAGNALYKISSGHTFAQWQAALGSQGVVEDKGSLYGGPNSPDAPGILPNFVSLATGNFAFNATYAGPGKATACTGTGGVSPACGLGFVPWNYNNVGASQ